MTARTGTRPLTRAVRLRRGDPARPHLVAAWACAVLVGATAPLVVRGVARGVDAGLSRWEVLALTAAWAGVVVLVLVVVLPWRRQVATALGAEEAALDTARATPRERRAYRARRFALTSAVATVLALPSALLLDVLVLVVLLAEPLGPTLVHGVVAVVVGGLAALVPTWRARSSAAPGAGPGLG